MTTRARYWLALALYVVPVIGALPLLPASAAAVVNLKGAALGSLVGVAVGVLPGLAVIWDLKRRMEGSTIRKPRGIGLLPYLVVIPVGMFYVQIAGSFCRAFSPEALADCLGFGYGTLIGLLFSAPAVTLVWVIVWEARHKTFLYME